MARFPQPKNEKRSQKWIQLWVNQTPEFFDAKIKENLPVISGEKITWLSPGAEDEYAEYRDQAFIDCLDVDLVNVPLDEF